MEQVYLKSPLQRLGRLIVDAKKLKKIAKDVRKKTIWKHLGVGKIIQT